MSIKKKNSPNSSSSDAQLIVVHLEQIDQTLQTRAEYGFELWRLGQIRDHRISTDRCVTARHCVAAAAASPVGLCANESFQQDLETHRQTRKCVLHRFRKNLLAPNKNIIYGQVERCQKASFEHPPRVCWMREPHGNHQARIPNSWALRGGSIRNALTDFVCSSTSEKPK